MTTARAFQPGDEAAFDWRRPAAVHDISIDVAHALYLRALRSVVEVDQAEMLYRRWLRQHVASREAGRIPTPGRHTQAHAGGRALGERALAMARAGRRTARPGDARTD
jgi:hypothetical protein